MGEKEEKIGGGCVKIKCLDHPFLLKVCDLNMFN
jgi:hypothetical protein